MAFRCFKWVSSILYELHRTKLNLNIRKFGGLFFDLLFYYYSKHLP